MNYFLSGAVFMAAAAAALFFFRFWKDSKDRFFLLFSMAFLLLGAERLPLLFKATNDDAHSSIYFFRLSAFILILIAIMEKNRANS